jgi:hypothetical protein
MTWVIGASSIWGSGVMLSDVRVTFANGREVDLIKKAFPVGRFICAGFAGSVQIGFQLIDHLRKYLLPGIMAQTPQAFQRRPPYVLGPVDG